MGASAFVALFGAIYELFSHEVYSYYMIYAFAVPLVFTALTYSVISLVRLRPPRLAALMWDYAAATLCVGCLFRGALDIYGTTNALSAVYPVAAGALAAAALTVLAVDTIKRKKLKASTKFQSTRL